MNMDNKQLNDKRELEKLFNYYKKEMYDSIETEGEVDVLTIKTEEEFYEMLTEEQKKKFEELNELNMTKNYNIHKNIFIWAYSLAVRTLIESIR